MLSLPILQPGESEKDRARRLLKSIAHAAYSALESAGVKALDEPLSETIVCRRRRTRLVVRLVPYDGPTYEPRNGARPASPSASPSRRPASPSASPRMSETDAIILEAAPGPSGKPVTVTKLAKLAGYADSGYFRRRVNKLIDAGELVRMAAGVRRATA